MGEHPANMLRAFLVLVVNLVATSAQVTHPWEYKEWVMLRGGDTKSGITSHTFPWGPYRKPYMQWGNGKSLADILDTLYAQRVRAVNPLNFVWGFKEGCVTPCIGVYGQFNYEPEAYRNLDFNASHSARVTLINASEAGDVYSTVPYGAERIGFIRKRVLYEHPSWTNTAVRFAMFGDSAWDPAWDPTANPTQDPTAKPTQDPTAKLTQDPTANTTQDPTAHTTQDPTAQSAQASMVTVRTTVRSPERRADESLVNGCHGMLTPEQQTLLNAAYQKVLEAAIPGEWRVSGKCTHLGYVLDGSMLTTMDSKTFSLVVSKASTSISLALVTEISHHSSLPTLIVSASPSVSSFVIQTAKPAPSGIHRGPEDTIGEAMLTLPALISIIVVLVGVLLACICYLKFRYKARADPVGSQPSAGVTVLPRDCQKVSLDKAKASVTKDEVVIFPGLGCADIPLKDDNEITEPEIALNKSLQCV